MATDSARPGPPPPDSPIYAVYLPLDCYCRALESDHAHGEARVRIDLLDSQYRKSWRSTAKWAVDYSFWVRAQYLKFLAPDDPNLLAYLVALGLSDATTL